METQTEKPTETSPIELALGDKPKFEKLLQEIEDLKTKYEFKAAKYKTVQSSVNELLDKTITYAKSKI
ncbi:MAG: hypothetical protein EKK61_03475 [Rickettsiales bacterium]|nr:MAG: hypothetical protein EKK61_03475 [Rickettsiales bacterium]